GGATVDGALNLVRQIREEFPDTPLGMLIYGNVPFTRGLDTFYEEFGAAGADAILLPDVPVREGAPFAAAAEKAGVAPVFGAPALLGFGISTPEHVADAVAAGAAGAITGSAITKIVDRYVSRETEDSPGAITDLDALKQEITDYVSQMKAATKK